ncbi:hypothetical protein FOMPIDRAFT_1053066 [Fomitopsis schrenkii]|uniref:DUF6532 domain-containing protein n=1 Tax=Fomitopsis schrenkii TaxID=2126942 RepID=S8E053_FOMSC|nr:hypothetical protein FOMPIDRAFT_1053066 [Fomitopsis schrenkii]
MSAEHHPNATAAVYALRFCRLLEILRDERATEPRLTTRNHAEWLAWAHGARWLVRMLFDSRAQAVVHGDAALPSVHSHTLGVPFPAIARSVNQVAAEQADSEAGRPLPSVRYLDRPLQLSTLQSSAEGWDSLVCCMQAIVQTQCDASNSARIEAMETHARLTAVELQLDGLSRRLGLTSPQGSEGAADAKPRPAYKGATRVATTWVVETEEEDEDMEMQDDVAELDEEERELAARMARGVTATKKRPSSPQKKDKKVAAHATPSSPSKGKGKAIPEPNVVPSTAGRVRRSSRVDWQVMEHVVAAPSGSKSNKTKHHGGERAAEKAAPSKTASSKTGGSKAKWFVPVREDEIVAEEDNGGSSNGGSNSGEDDGVGEDTSSKNTGDVIMVPRKASSAKPKAKGTKAPGMKRNRNCALATNLPGSISPVKNLAASYLKMYIALEGAWTKYTSMNNTRLLNRHEVIEKVMLSVRQHLIEGNCPSEVTAVFNQLGEEDKDSDGLRKMLTEVVWQGVLQVCNNLKKKAKHIVDESYGFTGLKPQKCEALAAWLSSTHRQTLKSGKVVKVPNFIFPVASVVWQEGQKGKGSGTIDENKSKLNRCMPFQHAAVLKLIYMFWLNGPMRAEVEVRQEKFSGVPDNLVALVCNALEAAIKDHLQASANNALDLQFSNKIYTPKWDDLMTLLEEIHNLSLAGYASMKSLIWAQIKEDEKVRRLDEEGPLSNPKNNIPFDDLAVDEVQVEDDVDTEGEHNKLESHKEGPSGAVKPGAAVGDQGKEGEHQ